MPQVPACPVSNDCDGVLPCTDGWDASVLGDLWIRRVLHASTPGTSHATHPSRQHHGRCALPGAALQPRRGRVTAGWCMAATSAPSGHPDWKRLWPQLSTGPPPPPSRCAGITLSQKQVERGTELAKERNIPNASFQVREPHTQSGESQACDRGIDGCDLTCTALCCVC